MTLNMPIISKSCRHTPRKGRALCRGQAICVSLYSCRQHIRLFPGPKELLVRWQSWKTLIGREAKSKPKWVNGFHWLPRTQIRAYCGFVQLVPTAENWEHMEQARVQLNLPSKMQVNIMHAFSPLPYKRLHMIPSDNAFYTCWQQIWLLWPWHFSKNKYIASFLGDIFSRVADRLQTNKKCLNILHGGSVAEKQLEIWRKGQQEQNKRLHVCHLFHKYSSLITTHNLPPDIEGRAGSL